MTPINPLQLGASHSDILHFATLLSRFQLPPTVMLDVTNVCNLKCIHCPQPAIQGAPDFRMQHMPWSIFAMLIDELAASSEPRFLRFSGDGEPTLHPKIVDMIELAKAKTSCVVNLTTNGTRLDREVVKRLLRAEIDVIDISLDALTKPTYATIRVGGEFETVLAGIFQLLVIRQEMHAKTKIFVSFVRQRENESECEQFVYFWRPLVDQVLVRNLHSANNRVKQDEAQARNHVRKIPRFPCPHPFKRLTVDFAGRIKFCPTDWGSGSVVGSLGPTSLGEAWKNLHELRRQHLNNDHPEEGICAACQDWAASPWDMGYERLIDAHVYHMPTLSPGLPLLDHK